MQQDTHQKDSVTRDIHKHSKGANAKQERKTMSLIERVKGWINMLFLSQAKEEFNIRSITSPVIWRK